MRYSYSYLLSLLLLFGPLFASAQTPVLAPAPAPADSAKIGIMSYNIRVGKGMDQVNDLQRIADVINRERPDFVALQEVDSVTVRTGGVNQIEELGRLTGLRASFAPAMTFSGGKYGVGILSREEPISVRRVPLPGREEPRVLLIVEFRNFIVASTHFSLTEADRIASAEIIIAEARQIAEDWQIDKPMFIAGDLNALPESATIRLLEQHFTLLSDKSAPTFPADRPDRCIDYIFGKFPAHLKFHITHRRVIPEAMASDHRPVMVEARWASGICQLN